MKKLIRLVGCAAFLILASAEMTGCAAPPVVQSAKKQIEAAESAMESGATLVRLRQYDLAVIEFDRALGEIRKAEGFATGNEATRLGVLKKDALKFKIDSDFAAQKKAGETAAKVKPTATIAGAAVQQDPEIAKRAAAKVKEAAQAANDKEVLAAISTTKTAKKAEEPPEDAVDLAVGKPKASKPSAEGEAEAPVVKAKPKDKNGIYADVTESTPPLQIAKLMRVGKFVVAYCQIYNKTDDGKRITVYNFFKDRDNQIAIPQLTTAAFPYDRFSPKVKDLIGDQSVRNLAPNSEEVLGHDILQFVSVGECNTEELAGKVVKLFLDVRLSDGTRLELTGPEGGAAPMPNLKIK